MPWERPRHAELGVVTKVVADADVDTEGLALAHSLASGPAEVIGLAKQLLLKSFETSIHEMMEYEGFGQVLCHVERRVPGRAPPSLSKRAPDFIGAAATFTSDGLPESKPEPPKA